MSGFTIYEFDWEARMTIVLDHREAQAEEKPREAPESYVQLISTPFGKLTEDEIRQWEKMLGCPLRRW